MEAFDMLMIRMVYPPLSTRQKIKKWFALEKWESNTKIGGLQKMKSGLNGLGSNSNGLILWENDATRFRIIFK